jgi:type II secretory pathway pseudopilin PulG
MFSRDRQGVGLMVLVCIVIAILLVAGSAGAWRASAATRARARVSSSRLLLAVGESAFESAVHELSQLANNPVESGVGSWRAALAGALAGTPRLQPEREIVPLALSRSLSALGCERGAQLGAVQVRVVRASVGDEERGVPPQGVLELKVEMRAQAGLFAARRVMRQRRAFWVSWEEGLPGMGDPAAPSAHYHIATHPIGTVME